MKSLIAYFAQRTFLARLITVMVFLAGSMSLMTLKLQEYPDIAFETVEITTEYPGATAQDVELNITNQIEKELKNVNGINQFISRSQEGVSHITVEMADGANATKVLADIQQAVDNVNSLPEGISAPPLVVQEDTSSLDVLTFGVIAQNSGVSPSDLQFYARDLEKKLKGVGGVSSVAMTGFNEREFWIELDPVKLSRYQTSFTEVMSAVQNRNISTSGGVIQSQNREQKLVTQGQVMSPKELATIIVKLLPDGRVIRVADVAQVADTFEKATQEAVINGHNAILFPLTNSVSSDIINTVKNVKALLAAETEQIGNRFGFEYGLNLADDMNAKFSIVSTNGAIGLVLVLIVLSLAMPRKMALWVSVSIPFCILGAMAVFPALGMNLDSITLAALLLVTGILVDDSVVVAESIYQERESGRNALDAAINGTSKVIKPVIASLTTTALVFIPMLFIPGSMGKAIYVIPVAVISVPLFSLMECTLTLPAHLARSLTTVKAVSLSDNKFSVISAYYQRILTKCLKYRKTVLAISLAGLCAGLGLATTLSLDIFPSQAARYIDVYTEVEPGTPLVNVRQAHAALETAIRSLWWTPLSRQ